MAGAQRWWGVDYVDLYGGFWVDFQCLFDQPIEKGGGCGGPFCWGGSAWRLWGGGGLAGAFDEVFDVDAGHDDAAAEFGFADEAAGDEALDGALADLQKLGSFFEGVGVFGGFLGWCDHMGLFLGLGWFLGGGGGENRGF